jgi:hypothetical protein
MRLTFKYLIGLWLILFSVIGMLIFNAYQKLKPEVLVALISEQIQRNYPGSSLEVGSVDYRVSVDFNMGLKDIQLKRSNKVIARLKEIEIRLPWWLLLFQQGNAQVNLNDLTIVIDANETSFLTKKSAAPDNKIKISVPNYLSQAHFTLRAKNITIEEENNSRRYFSLNKLLVREFQFGKNSAFELNLPISITHNGLNYKSELWLFGDLTPQKDQWDLKFRGEFRTSDANEKVQFEDLIIDGSAQVKPAHLDVISNLTFHVDKEEIGTGLFTANESQLDLKFTFDKLPLSFLAIFENEIKNPYFPELTQNARGFLEVSKNHKTEVLSFNGDLEFLDNFKLGKTSVVDVPGKWRINLNGSKWETSFISPKGEVSFFRRSVIDFKRDQVAQFVEEVGFTSVDFASAIELVPSLINIFETNVTNYSSSTVSFKKCTQGEKYVDGVLRFGVSPGEKYYLAEILTGESKLKVNFQQQSGQNKLDLSVVKFPWIGQLGLLKPYFFANSGILDGKLEGRWADNWLDGQWLSKINAKSLDAPQGEWINFLNSFWKQFEKEIIGVKDQDWNFKIKKGGISLDGLVIFEPSSTKISGFVDTNLKKKSSLVMSNPSNKKSRPVRKEVQEIFWEREKDE